MMMLKLCTDRCGMWNLSIYTRKKADAAVSASINATVEELLEVMSFCVV
jgi:hypothetical protein